MQKAKGLLSILWRFCQKYPMNDVTMRIDALLTGKPVLFRDQDYSAIAKQAVTGPVRIGWLGLEGDAQADPVNLGGWDKAVHLYPQDHYPFWAERMPGHPLLSAPGAFGENIASSGLDETTLCLGDRFSCGSAMLEISHGRQPCWKLDHRFGVRDVMATIVRTGRCGIYFRVIREGTAEAGDVMTLMERPLPAWSISRVFSLLIGGGHKRERDAVRALADMPVLAEAWRGRARKLLG